MYLKRVKVPFISDFPEGRGISGHILTNILKHLDDLKVYDNDRENDVIPLMLVVVHGSYFCLYFFNTYVTKITNGPSFLVFLMKHRCGK